MMCLERLEWVGKLRPLLPSQLGEFLLGVTPLPLHPIWLLPRGGPLLMRQILYDIPPRLAHQRGDVPHNRVLSSAKKTLPPTKRKPCQRMTILGNSCHSQLFTDKEHYVLCAPYFNYIIYTYYCTRKKNSLN